MTRAKNALTVLSCLIAFGAQPAKAQEPGSKPALQVDVPVSARASKVVFNMDHLAFAGDQPIGLMHMKLMVQAYKDQQTPLEIVAVFHSAAGYMLLNDQVYNRARRSEKGNPYKDQILALQREGVQFEECVQTAKVNGWTNSDLLPGVKVNAGANLRLVQLAQDGFVLLHP